MVIALHSTMPIVLRLQSREYDVVFCNNHIKTTVTESDFMVDQWVDDIERIHRSRLHKLLVGLDIEWRPNFRPKVKNRVATLQLCVGRRCLIFKLLHTKAIPQSLIAFLNNQNYTFVGVGIHEDVEKLMEDHGLYVARVMDLRYLAALRYHREGFKKKGLKQLALEVLGNEMIKPKKVTLSNWDAKFLTGRGSGAVCLH